MLHDPKFANIPQYVDWLVRQSRKFQESQEKQDIYRLINVKYTLFGRCKLKIHVLDSNVCFEATPTDIAQNDIMIAGFSRQDVRMITYFACEEVHKPIFMIRLKRFYQRLNKTLFSIQERGEKNLLRKTASEISKNQAIIKGLSPEESHLVGYVAGRETALQKAQAKCQDLQLFKTLTKRERECLLLLLKGKTAKEIANTLKISPKSVESYLNNAKVKFKCYTRTQLFEKAFACGLIDVVSTL